MLVYKATDADMTCHMGQGIFQYELGVPATAEASKCASTGLHACEYVVDCLRYYALDSNHRYFMAEAEGDIAEDGANTRIACTKLTLMQELGHVDIAREAMKFMIKHPKREGWTYSGTDVQIKRDYACQTAPGGIAIARGADPSVQGGMNTYIGLLQEQDGRIIAAKLCHITVDGPIKPYKIYNMHDIILAFEEYRKGGSYEAEND